MVVEKSEQMHPTPTQSHESEWIEPLISLQNETAVQIKERSLSLDSDLSIQAQGTTHYMELLGVIRWVLPVEGFIARSELTDSSVNTYGVLEWLVIQSLNG